MIKRRKTKKIKIGYLEVGGNPPAPVSVQTMTNTNTSDVKATVKQILSAERAGCDLIRIAVDNQKSAEAISAIKKRTNIPIIADIHFSHLLAIKAAKFGIDKLRINPGNVGRKQNESKRVREKIIKEIADIAKKKKIPIRIGVNMGSLDPKMEEKYGRTAEAMVHSALEEIKALERHGFGDIIIAMKASDVGMTVEAYRELAKVVDYPFHVGITETGLPPSGIVKSSIGIGVLLLEGIGDTIRVSLTAPVAEEVEVGLDMLRCLRLRKEGVDFISCPTCGRRYSGQKETMDLIKISKELKEALKNEKRYIKVAVMGCSVNGLGEAKDADVGVMLKINSGEIYPLDKTKKYEVPKDKILPEMFRQIDLFFKNKKKDQ
ncbi:MAG: hypothetical protein ACD_63C00249G0003 [uncultured bacterium]|nr:MAG: hypothetical protein ACD_63C00249G0003 [uncultured bacterium]